MARGVQSGTAVWSGRLFPGTSPTLEWPICPFGALGALTIEVALKNYVGGANSQLRRPSESRFRGKSSAANHCTPLGTIEKLGRSIPDPAYSLHSTSSRVGFSTALLLNSGSEILKARISERVPGVCTQAADCFVPTPANRPFTKAPQVAKGP